MIDREVHEVWYAAVVNQDGGASLGGWASMPPNEQAGRLLTPIQAAMR